MPPRPCHCRHVRLLKSGVIHGQIQSSSTMPMQSRRAQQKQWQSPARKLQVPQALHLCVVGGQWADWQRSRAHRQQVQTNGGAKEMMQPRLNFLHVISLRRTRPTAGQFSSSSRPGAKSAIWSRQSIASVWIGPFAARRLSAGAEVSSTSLRICPGSRNSASSLTKDAQF